MLVVVPSGFWLYCDMNVKLQLKKQCRAHVSLTLYLLKVVYNAFCITHHKKVLREINKGMKKRIKKILQDKCNQLSQICCLM